LGQLEIAIATLEGTARGENKLIEAITHHPLPGLVASDLPPKN
jgi:hypothetical protein